MTAALVTAAAVLLLILSVEAARENKDRGVALVGFANAMVAGASAALAGAPYVECMQAIECGGALAFAVSIRIMVDRRLCPRAFRFYKHGSKESDDGIRRSL